MAIFIDRLTAGKSVTIFGDGEQERDFVYVADVVAALLAAAASDGGGTYNVGTGVATSVNTLWERCKAVSGSQAEATHAEPRAGDLRRSVLDPGRAKVELGWQPEHDVENGLRRTWAWASSR